MAKAARHEPTGEVLLVLSVAEAMMITELTGQCAGTMKTTSPIYYALVATINYRKEYKVERCIEHKDWVDLEEAIRVTIR